MSLNDRRLQENLRLRLGTTVNIPETDWIVDADWIWNNSRREWVSLDPAWPLVVDSLRCQGGPNGDSCWNPFSTAWLSQDPATGLVLPAEHQSWRSKDDPAWNTSTETRQRRLESAPRSARHRHGDAGHEPVEQPPVRPLVQRDPRRHRRGHTHAHRRRGVPTRPVRRGRHLVRPRGLPRHRRRSAGGLRRSARHAHLQRDVRPDGDPSRDALHGVRHQRLVRLDWPVGRIRRHDPETGDPLPAHGLARGARQHDRGLRAAGQLPAILLGTRRRLSSRRSRTTSATRCRNSPGALEV